MASAGAGAPRASRCLAAALLTLCAGAVQAQKAEVAPGDSIARKRTVVTPSLSISQTYTDNVSLAPEGSKRSDSVTQVVPGILIVSAGPRLRFNASYAPELLYYRKLEREDTVFHRGSAVGNLVLADELLFVEGGAKIDQYDVSLRGPLTTSNVSSTGNRATARTSYLTPYLQHDFGSEARVEARFTASTFRSDDQAVLSDSDAGRAHLRFASGPAYERLTWEHAYDAEVIEYEQGQETESEVLTAAGRLRVTPSVGLLAQAGNERYDAGFAGSEFDGPRWNLGLEWTPTPRTRLAATAGKRLDDDTYSLELRHRTRLTAWSANYREDVATTRSEFFVPGTADTAGTLEQLFAAQYPDPAERQKAVQEFIARSGLPPSLAAPVNFFSQQFFLHKRWTASAAFQGARNTVVANAFWETREALFSSLPVTGDFSVSDSIRASGAGLVWSWRLTPRLTWNLDASYTRSEFLDTNRVDDYTTLRMSISRQFQPRLSGSLAYRRQQNESTQGVNEYVENAALASLLMTF